MTTPSAQCAKRRFRANTALVNRVSNGGIYRFSINSDPDILQRIVRIFRSVRSVGCLGRGRDRVGDVLWRGKRKYVRSTNPFGILGSVG